MRTPRPSESPRAETAVRPSRAVSHGKSPPPDRRSALSAVKERASRPRRAVLRVQPKAAEDAEMPSDEAADGASRIVLAATTPYPRLPSPRRLLARPCGRVLYLPASQGPKSGLQPASMSGSIAVSSVVPGAPPAGVGIWPPGYFARSSARAGLRVRRVFLHALHHPRVARRDAVLLGLRARRGHVARDGDVAEPGHVAHEDEADAEDARRTARRPGTGSRRAG